MSFFKLILAKAKKISKPKQSMESAHSKPHKCTVFRPTTHRILPVFLFWCDCNGNNGTVFVKIGVAVTNAFSIAPLVDHNGMMGVFSGILS